VSRSQVLVRQIGEPKDRRAVGLDRKGVGKLQVASLDLTPCRQLRDEELATDLPAALSQFD
jgi:hypothetical protein